jgi:cell wall-associated NlpC family hydrolase
VYECAPGRHRAPQRATTPLTPLAVAVGERVNQINPAGLVVAVSSGLLATGGIPLPGAGAAQVATRTAHVAVAPGGHPATLGEGLLASGAAFAAPDADDTLTFDRAAFTAVPKPPPPVRQQAPTATVARTATVSRSTQRTAQPTRSSTTRTTAASTPVTGAVSSGILAIAARYVGIPYVYGGRTPRGFDCSGYVQYVYKLAGKNLPRTADEQMRAGRQISRSQAQDGDLVAFVSGGVAYHIGLYAGGNMMYDSPHTGASVSKRSIWTAAVVFVRV